MANEAVNLNTIMVLIRWLLGHSAEAQLLVTLYGDLTDAPTPAAKVRVVAEMLRVVSEIMDDFPDLQPLLAGSPELTAADQQLLAAEAAARRIDWAKLLALIEKLLPILLPIFLDHPKNE